MHNIKVCINGSEETISRGLLTFNEPKNNPTFKISKATNLHLGL